MTLLSVYWPTEYEGGMKREEGKVNPAAFYVPPLTKHEQI